MNELAPAAFRLENYRFTEFSFKQPANEDDMGLAVRLSPSGIYFKKDKRFVLLLDFEAYSEKAVANEAGETPPVIKVAMQAGFVIENEGGEIPEYFHGNIIGISFPFLRSFISTLTLQANTTQLILPIANLTHLVEPLKDNTQVIEDDELI